MPAYYKQNEVPLIKTVEQISISLQLAPSLALVVTPDNQLFRLLYPRTNLAWPQTHMRNKKTTTELNRQCYWGDKYLSNNMHINWSFVPAHI